MTPRLVLLAAALLAMSCAATTARRQNWATAPPRADATAVLLWRLDETGGTRVLDAGPLRAHGIAGLDTRTEFGRFRNARVFSRSKESFLYLPYQPGLEPAAITIEAWIRPYLISDFEDATIAARWTERETEQSWLFAIVGRKYGRTAQMSSPGFHRTLVAPGLTGQLMFAYQPEQAGAVRTYFSVGVIDPERWTHVAVSHDREIVRFFIDGQLDAEYVSPGAIRSTATPLLVGNAFDSQVLSAFGGDLKVGERLFHDPVYAFEGLIDEFRLSAIARPESALGR